MSTRIRWYGIVVGMLLTHGTALTGPTSPTAGFDAATSTRWEKLGRAMISFSIIAPNRYSIEFQRLMDARSNARNTYAQWQRLFDEFKFTEAKELEENNPMLFRETTMRDEKGQLQRTNYLLPYAIRFIAEYRRNVVIFVTFIWVQIISLVCLISTGVSAACKRPWKRKVVLSFVVVFVVGAVGAEISRALTISTLREAVEQWGGNATQEPQQKN